MANVSPTFNTHYGASSLNKNFVYNAGNNYANRWGQVTQLPDVKFVQVSSMFTIFLFTPLSFSITQRTIEQSSTRFTLLISLERLW